ncbi:MAG: T9SS type A sorting domain-containing protein [Ignavibacteriales bacterium]|nr:T9SS type A sorting domain-containing protein [Ignavibacteriales bacterium]
MILDYDSTATPDQIYESIINSANTTNLGSIPNNKWGNGKLDIYAALNYYISHFTDIESEKRQPLEFKLSQNYPNPFNPITKINYSIPARGQVKLVVYDILGQEVKTLVNEIKEAGFYSIDFNASSLASGIYIYKLTCNEKFEVKKMNLLK